jgi:peptidoglycan/LPS O-acetylase OafA/YrhL
MVWRGVLIIGGATEVRLVVGPDVRADAIVIGCLLALVARGDLLARRRVHILTCAALTGCCFFPGMLSAPWRLTAATVVSAMVLSICVSTSPLRLFLWTPLLWLGKRSYAVYLWHGLVAYGLNAVGAPPPLNLILTLASATAIAVGSWNFIERPILFGRPGPARGPSVDARAPVRSCPE